MGQEFRHGLAGFSASESSQSEVLDKAGVSSEGSIMEGSASKPTWLLAGFNSLRMLD